MYVISVGTTHALLKNMNATTQATNKMIATSYRAAKAHLETILGVSTQIGLDLAVKAAANTNEAFCPELAIKAFYQARGADVSACAVKTLAYARMARAWELYSV